MPNLIELLPAFEKPFSVELLDFLPGKVFEDKEDKSKFTALAFPFTEIHAYQDRLNAVCPGEWESRTTITATASKIIAIVDIMLCGKSYSGVGEAPASDENGTTSAWSQAFKRACAQFRLGRYLYDLPSKYFPYNKANKKFANTETDRAAVARKMYIDAGFIKAEQRPRSNQAQPTQPVTPPAPAKVDQAQPVQPQTAQPVPAPTPDQLSTIAALARSKRLQVVRPTTSAAAAQLIAELQQAS